MDPSEIRQAIGDCDDLPIEAFVTPEWPTVDGHLYLRGLTADEQDEREVFLANAAIPGNGENRALKIGTTHIRAFVVARGLVTESGERVFGDSEKDLSELGRRSGSVLDRAYDRIMELSGLGGTSQDTLEKNSETAPGDSSLST